MGKILNEYLSYVNFFHSHNFVEPVELTFQGNAEVYTLKVNFILDPYIFHSSIVLAF